MYFNRAASVFLSIILAGSAAFAAFDLRGGATTPMFVSPGGNFGVTLSGMHDYNNSMFLAGVISADTVWSEADDYIFMYDGANGTAPLTFAAFNANPKTTANVTASVANTAYEDYLWNSSMPAAFGNGQTVYIIIRGHQGASQWVAGMAALDQIIIPVEISNFKGVVYNTATFGEKKATGMLIVVGGPPPATLIATPGSSTFNTPTLAVTLSSNTGNRIWYSTDGSVPDTNNAAQLLNAGANTGSVSIRGTTTIRAITTGPGYTPTSGSWTYTGILPQLSIVADPVSGSSFDTRDTIFLSAQFNGAAVSSSRIYYTTSRSGGTSAPDSQSGTLYDPARGIVISDSITIYATAYNEAYVPGSGTFSYALALKAVTIYATPSASPYFRFGLSLDSIVLSGNADSLRWIMSSRALNAADSLMQYGALYSAADLIGIYAADADTMYLSVLGYGHGYQPAVRVFTYVRRHLSDLIATPAGQKFSGSISPELSLDTAGLGIEGFEIWYTLDGSTPTVGESATNHRYTAAIVIHASTTLKAIAIATGAVQSGMLTERYILAIGSDSAVFHDADGNGSIDSATIFLSGDMATVPDSIVFSSPFDSAETITVYPSDMHQNGARILAVRLPRAFTFTSSTAFATDTLGIFFGDAYCPGFAVGDAVAPVILSGHFSPGKIISTIPAVQRGKDVLAVRFSEALSMAPSSSPFNLKTASGRAYTFELADNVTQSDMLWTFNEVLSAHSADTGNAYPAEGDSLRMDIAAQFNQSGGGALQRVVANRWAPLTVDDEDFLFTIAAVSPVNPATFDIPGNIRPAAYNSSKGIVVVGDFQAKLNNAGTLRAEAQIFDQLGTVIARTNSSDANGEFCASLIDGATTRLVFCWDGKNKNGRYVAAGLYPCKYRISNGSFIDLHGTVMLGIDQ